MGKVKLYVTVDWDGLDDLKSAIFNRGIGAITNFIKEFKDVPLVHFICPVYFTRNPEIAGYYSGVIRSLLKRSQHEIGLHIHCWESLISACGITPKIPHENQVPSFHRDEFIVEYEGNLQSGAIKKDIGHGVPFGIYAEAEIEIILQKSRQLLIDNHLIAAGQTIGFRCGGGLACDRVLRAVEHTGFAYDASAIDAAYARGINDYLIDCGVLLGVWKDKLWGPLPQTEPYLQNSLFHKAYPEGIQICGDDGYTNGISLLKAQPENLTGRLKEFPITCALADYVTVEYMLDHVDKAVALASSKAHGHRDIIIQLGFHLESAPWKSYGEGLNIDKLHQALHQIRSKHDAKIVFTTIKGLAGFRGTPLIPGTACFRNSGNSLP